jgi:hypothetical protein
MRIYVHTSNAEDPKIVEVEPGGTVAELVKTVGGELIWLEDVDDEIDQSITLESAGVKELSHVHVGRCKKIEVSVRFGGETKTRKFAPSARIRRVTKWATGPNGFDLSEAEAEKHVLELPGADHRVPDRTHVGSIANPKTCSVVLDLQPKVRHEG